MSIPWAVLVQHIKVHRKILEYFWQGTCSHCVTCHCVTCYCVACHCVTCHSVSHMSITRHVWHNDTWPTQWHVAQEWHVMQWHVTQWHNDVLGRSSTSRRSDLALVGGTLFANSSPRYVDDPGSAMPIMRVWLSLTGGPVSELHIIRPPNWL